MNASVSSDVQSVFKGKTYNQLQVIYQGIEGKILAGGPNLDIGYWESLLQQLKAYMARARYSSSATVAGGGGIEHLGIIKDSVLQTSVNANL